MWAHHAQQERGAALIPTPVSRPAPSLAELQYSLAYLPSCRLQLLQGRQPTDAPASATALLLRCGRAFAAVVHLQQPGSLQPLRVGVLSAAQADAAISGSSSNSSSGRWLVASRPWFCGAGTGALGPAAAAAATTWLTATAGQAGEVAATSIGL